MPRFKNLDDSGPHPLRNVIKWGVVDRLNGTRRRTPARALVPRVAPDHATLALPPLPGEPARLTWLGHASWLVQLDGVSLLIDPALHDTIAFGAQRNVPPGIAIADLPAIDAQLVSHNHFDHLDAPTLRAVGRPVIAGLGLRPLMQKLELACTELGWWESTSIGDVTIHFVPSQHWSRRGLADTNATLWGGFVMDGPSACLYHSGDTAYFEGFTEIGRRYRTIDAAMLPIGAYEPDWFMARQHMNPEQAVQGFRDLGARAFFAMHWGTFKLTDEPLLEPPKRLHAEWARVGLPEEHKHVLAVGETREIRGPRAPALQPGT